MEGDSRCEREKERVNHDSLTFERKRQGVQIKGIQHIHNWNNKEEI